jgi:hypothetical protein
MRRRLDHPLVSRRQILQLFIMTQPETNQQGWPSTGSESWEAVRAPFLYRLLPLHAGQADAASEAVLYLSKELTRTRGVVATDGLTSYR